MAAGGGEGKAARSMSQNKTTKKSAGAQAPRVYEYESYRRLDELLALRSLAPATMEEYRRYVRKLGLRVQRDPAGLEEHEVREYLLRLKTHQHYSPSSMRGACAALRFYYGHVLGRDWKLFDLVRTPTVQHLPQVLSREEVGRLFGVLREPRFRVLLRLIYACGLRVGEAVRLEVRDVQAGCRLHLRQTKGNKERYVPLPGAMLEELRQWWKLHRHPRLLFPGVGRGWKEHRRGVVAGTDEPMSISSVQHCFRQAVTEARLPREATVHTLRHSYATHLLEAGVSLRLISAYLGHTSLDTTVIYTHLTAVSEEKARAVVDGLLPAG